LTQACARAVSDEKQSERLLYYSTEKHLPSFLCSLEE